MGAEAQAWPGEMSWHFLRQRTLPLALTAAPLATLTACAASPQSRRLTFRLSEAASGSLLPEMRSGPGLLLSVFLSHLFQVVCVPLAFSFLPYPPP